MILEQCKGVHCVDLGESFQTHIYLQILASIQPRTSPLKFAGSCAGTTGSRRVTHLICSYQVLRCLRPGARDQHLGHGAPLQHLRVAREEARGLV